MPQTDAAYDDIRDLVKTLNIDLAKLELTQPILRVSGSRCGTRPASWRLPTSNWRCRPASW